jgi:hypothetical protein
MATYTTSTTLSSVEAYVLTLTLTEKGNSKGSVTVDYSLTLTSKQGYSFSDVGLGWKIMLGSTTLAYQSRSGHQMNMGKNTTITLDSGSGTVSQGANLDVSVVIDSATTTYSPGPMKISGKFSTSMVYKLTVNYHSNYATEMSEKTPLKPVGPDKDVIVFTDILYSNVGYENGLYNYNTFGLTRNGYKSTGNWGTELSGGTLVNQNTGFALGTDVAKALGKDISNRDDSVDIYAQWECLRYYKKEGEWAPCEIKVLQNGKWVFCEITELKR